MLKMYSKTKKKYDNIHNKIIDKTKFNFLQRVKHKITNKVIMNRNFNILYGTIKKLYRRRYFKELYKRIDKFCINTKKLTCCLMRKIGIGSLRIRSAERKAEKLKINKMKKKFKNHTVDTIHTKSDTIASINMVKESSTKVSN